ncbi:DUF6328 family protein [Nocardia asteroides]|uniref:DUF6328 family protein n=1 Tax=Nocardia asteroides TaxID=1824 RepID=UPI001E50EC82|nr:DUF6328 family protein [Nocardia asteroides]UGT55887.1 DUF6328 family protein [Nocardia asteroides]
MDDSAWNLDVRGENETQRLDRNWSSLLQELRVVQTGVQLLTGFLIVLPFQPRFDAMNTPMRVLYLIVLSSSIGATALLVAPVAAHRIVFRQHQLAWLVDTAHQLALGGLALLGVALVGVAVLLFDVVAGPLAAVVAGVLFGALFVVTWLVRPLLERRRSARR